jgi:hypothetical protein
MPISDDDDDDATTLFSLCSTFFPPLFVFLETSFPDLTAKTPFHVYLLFPCTTTTTTTTTTIVVLVLLLHQHCTVSQKRSYLSLVASDRSAKSELEEIKFRVRDVTERAELAEADSDESNALLASCQR